MYGVGGGRWQAQMMSGTSTLPLLSVGGERWATVERDVCKGKSVYKQRNVLEAHTGPCVAVSQGVQLGTSVARLLKECGERNVVRGMTCGM